MKGKWIFMNETTRREYIRKMVDKYCQQGMDVKDAWDRIMDREEAAYKKLRKQATR